MPCVSPFSTSFLPVSHGSWGPHHFVGAGSRTPSLAARWQGCCHERACHRLRHLQPARLLGTAGRGEGAVGAKGDSKRDSSVRGKEAPAGSV